LFAVEPTTRLPYPLRRVPRARGGLRLASALCATAALGCGDPLAPGGLQISIVEPAGLVDAVAALGQMVRFSATPRAGWSTRIDSADLRWSSSDSTILAIGALTGVGTSLSSGSVTISAAAGGITGSRELTVAPRIVSLELRPPDPSVWEADTLLLTVIAKDANGYPVADTPPAEWSTSDTVLAVIDAAGLLTARRRGVVTVRAAIGAVAATVGVRVQDGFLVTSIDNSSDGGTCAVDLEGVGYCWGGGSLLAGRVPGEVRWATLTAGWSHYCGIATDGLAYCWGSNGHGELGLGVTSSPRVLEPTLVTVLQGFTRIRATAHNFTCALTTTTEPYCWGHNDRGQLGRGFRSTAEPSAAPPLNVPQLVTVDGDMFHACGITPEGVTKCWGIQSATGVPSGTTSDTAVVIDTDVPLVTLSTGSLFTCGLTTQGAAWCWGFNQWGNLGTGDTIYAPTPRPVTGGLTFAAIDAGGWHACGITPAGDAYCWGNADQLIDGGTTASLAPVLVVSGHRFQSIAAGSGGACAITDRRAVYCWGSGLPGPTRVVRGDLGAAGTASVAADFVARPPVHP